MQPKSYADFLYKSLYTSFVSVSNLRRMGKCREVQMYGSANGYKLVGRIDQLEMHESKVMISEDKTKASFKLPTDAQLRTNKIQLFVYRRMMEDIMSGEYGVKNFSAGYSTSNLKLTDEFIRQLKAIGVEERLHNLPAISEAFFASFPKLGALSDTLKLRYMDQITGDEIKIYTFEYDKTEADEAMRYVLKYWNGERKAAPVPEGEKWKCNFCVFFGKECKVWWNQKELNM
jgi:exonuclease V